MKDLLSDLRLGLRNLRSRPLFTLIGALTLGLGIGANTTIFSLVDGVLLRPLPFAKPDRLVLVSQFSEEAGKLPASYPNYADWRAGSRTFADMAAYTGAVANVGAREPERLKGARVTSGLFHLLGAQPALGRTFSAAEDTPSGERVVVLSHGLWLRSFGGDPGILGHQVTLDGEPHTVVGVMPGGFEFPNEEAEFWTALRGDPLASRDLRSLKVVGRLAPGVPLARAEEEMAVVAARLARDHPEENAGMGVRLTGLRESLVGDLRPLLLIFFGAVSFVLLIACVNVANMMLFRAEGRKREIAIRGALGAGTLRLVRQCLSESVLLFLLGGGLGLLLADLAFRLLIVTAPYEIPRLDEAGLDGRVLLFCVLLSALTGLLFGLIPALRSARPDLRTTLGEEGNNSTGGVRRKRLQDLLVVCEVALALVLLISAGLLIRSFGKLSSVDPGFDAANVLTLKLPFPDRFEMGSPAAAGFYEGMVERLGRLRGVETAGAVAFLPGGDSLSRTFTIEGRAAASEERLADYNLVTPGYFEAMSIPLLAGRAPSARDGAGSVPVALVNRTMARRFWPNGDALGKRIKFGEAGEPGDWLEIVGVVQDVRHHGLAADVEPEIYQPYAQFPYADEMTVVLRTDGTPAALVPAVRREVRAADGTLPIVELTTMQQRLAQGLAKARFNMLILTLFALVATALAAAGVYGVISSRVQRQSREIAIRMALGASPARTLRWILMQQLRWITVGMAAGLCGAFALTRILRSLLFGLGPLNPAVFLGVSLLLLGIGVLACYLPASRAAKVNPRMLLQHEST